MDTWLSIRSSTKLWGKSRIFYQPPHLPFNTPPLLFVHRLTWGKSFSQLRMSLLHQHNSCALFTKYFLIQSRTLQINRLSFGTFSLRMYKYIYGLYKKKYTNSSWSSVLTICVLIFSLSFGGHVAQLVQLWLITWLTRVRSPGKWNIFLPPCSLTSKWVAGYIGAWQKLPCYSTPPPSSLFLSLFATCKNK